MTTTRKLQDGPYRVRWTSCDGSGSAGPFDTFDEAHDVAERMQDAANHTEHEGWINPWDYRHTVENRFGNVVYLAPHHARAPRQQPLSDPGHGRDARMSTTDPRAISAPATELERFIELGMSHHNPPSLEWRASITGPDMDEHGTYRALMLAGSYGDFDPADAFDVIHANAAIIAGVELAREGSPALYLTLARWDHQSLQTRWERLITPEPGHTGHRYTLEELNANARGLIVNMRELNPDELHLTVLERHGMRHLNPTRGAGLELTADHTPYQLRAWWD